MNMKETNKKYVKPDVEAVAFNMTSNISGTCGTFGGKQASYLTCTFEFTGNVSLFVTGLNGCAFSEDDNKVCYHNPADDIRIFSS
jgi:hypothetical protein